MRRLPGPAVTTFVAAASLVLAACSSGGLAEGCTAIDAPGVRSGLAICQPEDRPAAPVDLAFPLVGDNDAEASLSDFDAEVLVVNFWGAWCAPCRTEQPELNVAHDRLASRDVAFVGVAITDSDANQQAFRDEFAVPYPSLFDQPNALAAAFRGAAPPAPPTTLILDAQGRVVTSIIGSTTTEEVVGVVEAVLAFEPTAG